MLWHLPGRTEEDITLPAEAANCQDEQTQRADSVCRREAAGTQQHGAAVWTDQSSITTTKAHCGNRGTTGQQHLHTSVYI